MLFCESVSVYCCASYKAVVFVVEASKVIMVRAGRGHAVRPRTSYVEVSGSDDDGGSGDESKAPAAVPKPPIKKRVTAAVKKPNRQGNEENHFYNILKTIFLIQVFRKFLSTCPKKISYEMPALRYLISFNPKE